MSMNLKTHHHLALYIAIASLLFAYFVEYIMALAPCPLCIYQRFPYLILFALAIFGLNSRYFLHWPYKLTICSSLLMAGYHTGIERSWWQLSSFCKPLVRAESLNSATQFQEMLYSGQIAMCDKPSLVIIGLSMTELNFLFNLLLLFGLLFYKKRCDSNA